MNETSNSSIPDFEEVDRLANIHPSEMQVREDAEDIIFGLEVQQRFERGEPFIPYIRSGEGMKLNEEQKQMRKEIAEIRKRLNKERGKDRIKYHNVGNDFSYRTFVLFDGTEVSEGGWLIGYKWMTAKYMNKIVDKWVKRSYETRADTYLKQKFSMEVDIEKLKEIDREYDLSAGCGQCGGCRWFVALDADYGFCFNQDSPNEGKITFEHGGCIQHSFIQELLNSRSGED